MSARAGERTRVAHLPVTVWPHGADAAKTHTHTRAGVQTRRIPRPGMSMSKSYARAESHTLCTLTATAAATTTPYYIYFANFRKISDKNAPDNLWLAGAGRRWGLPCVSNNMPE